MQTVILLGLVSLLTDISSEMVYPLLSLYLTTSLGATPAIIGVIEGIAESLASLLKVYSLKRLPVLDASGKFMGLVSRDALLRTGFQDKW